jgi:hypothetical protein
LRPAKQTAEQLGEHSNKATNGWKENSVESRRVMERDSQEKIKWEESGSGEKSNCQFRSEQMFSKQQTISTVLYGT